MIVCVGIARYLDFDAHGFGLVVSLDHFAVKVRNLKIKRFQMADRGMRNLLARAQTRQKAKSGCLTKPFSGVLGEALKECLS